MSMANEVTAGDVGARAAKERASSVRRGGERPWWMPVEPGDLPFYFGVVPLAFAEIALLLLWLAS